MFILATRKGLSRNPWPSWVGQRTSPSKVAFPPSWCQPPSLQAQNLHLRPDHVSQCHPNFWEQSCTEGQRISRPTHFAPLFPLRGD